MPASVVLVIFSPKMMAALMTGCGEKKQEEAAMHKRVDPAFMRKCGGAVFSRFYICF